MRKIEKLFWSVYVLLTTAEKVFNFSVVERTGTAVKEWERRCTACKAAFFVVKYANFVNFLSHEKKKKKKNNLSFYFDRIVRRLPTYIMSITQSISELEIEAGPAVRNLREARVSLKYSK